MVFQQHTILIKAMTDMCKCTASPSPLGACTHLASVWLKHALTLMGSCASQWPQAIAVVQWPGHICALAQAQPSDGRRLAATTGEAAARDQVTKA